MTQEYFFKNAKWVGNANATTSTFSVLRGKFSIENVKKVSLNVLGLGFFKCFINGICINPDTFLPLSSDYENSGEPKDEVLSGHRIYVPQFDITSFIKSGENVIAVFYGGGWYTHKERVFGLPKAIYCIEAETDDGILTFCSDENCRIGNGFVEEYDFVNTEKHNFVNWKNCFDADFDDGEWQKAEPVKGPQTQYFATNCPADKLIKKLSVTKLGKGEFGTVYDCSLNTTGYPVLKINAKKGETVRVRFSEEILPNGNLDPEHLQRQVFEVVSDGTPRLAQPEFTWFGFRYFEIVGDAEADFVKVIHADVPITSSFECDNETLNWTYQTFINTMLCNMHTGHPSDCPHLERRGYTGDGQLTTHAVLSIFDARAFYEKWLQDIADSQDVLSGHIQYTAPYIRSGGGPGGWGSAIVEVPYQMYRHFGDKKYLSKYYKNMCRYIDYLEAHSEFGLVTSDKQGEWCLGDWCGPNILYSDKDITFCEQQVFLPAGFVNTYFMVKSLEKMCEIARVIGKNEDIAEFEEKIKMRKNAIRAAYFNAFDNNFIMNIQGANAFALDINLGNEKTYSNMLDYYKKVACFDTGIFGTDILTRLLFSKGEGELAVSLLTNDGPQGYEHWRKNGATTFHEYWDSERSRSHCHPMFGAPVAYFFEYLLGIKQEEDSVGYTSLVIEPQAVSNFKKMSGSMQIPVGKVEVAYERNNNSVNFDIVIPKNIKARFIFNDKEIELKQGKNVVVIND